MIHHHHCKLLYSRCMHHHINQIKSIACDCKAKEKLKKKKIIIKNFLRVRSCWIGIRARSDASVNELFISLIILVKKWFDFNFRVNSRFVAMTAWRFVFVIHYTFCVFTLCLVCLFDERGVSSWNGNAFQISKFQWMPPFRGKKKGEKYLLDVWCFFLSVAGSDLYVL